jgi:hypothetical protein
MKLIQSLTVSELDAPAAVASADIAPVLAALHKLQATGYGFNWGLRYRMLLVPAHVRLKQTCV